MAACALFMCAPPLARAQPDSPSTQTASAAPSSEPSPAGPSPAEPSPADLARARTLFQKGVELADDGQYTAAATRFRAALAIRRAPAVEYNLAAALFELRQFQEAFNTCQNVLRSPEAPDALKTKARALDRSLYPHVARLTVLASSADNDLSVRVDDEPLPSELMGVTRAVPPGRHTVLAQRAEVTVAERTVDVPLRTAAIIDVSLIVTEAEAAVARQQAAAPLMAPVAPEPRRDEPNPRRKRLWMWTGIAVGVVVTGAAVGLGIGLSKKESKREQPVAGDFQPGVLTWR